MLVNIIGSIETGLYDISYIFYTGRKEEEQYKVSDAAEFLYQYGYIQTESHNKRIHGEFGQE